MLLSDQKTWLLALTYVLDVMKEKHSGALNQLLLNSVAC